MGYTELRLAKRIQLVFSRPVGREKDAGPNKNALKTALYSNSPDVGEGESTERGCVPPRVIISGEGHPPGEPPRASNMEAVCSKIVRYVSPSAVYLQALSTCGLGQHHSCH